MSGVQGRVSAEKIKPNFRDLIASAWLVIQWFLPARRYMFQDQLERDGIELWLVIEVIGWHVRECLTRRGHSYMQATKLSPWHYKTQMAIEKG
jgi:hypothetical protein